MFGSGQKNESTFEWPPNRVVKWGAMSPDCARCGRSLEWSYTLADDTDVCRPCFLDLRDAGELAPVEYKPNRRPTRPDFLRELEALASGGSGQKGEK